MCIYIYTCIHKCVSVIYMHMCVCINVYKYTNINIYKYTHISSHRGVDSRTFQNQAVEETHLLKTPPNYQ